MDSLSLVNTPNPLKKELDSLQATHRLTLELLGEATERIKELETDIIEMKAIFHEQLQSLLPLESKR